MKQMTPTAVERAMKLQDVMLRAMAKRITWFQAAEILGISCRQMQRWHTRFEHEGYGGPLHKAFSFKMLKEFRSCSGLLLASSEVSPCWIC
jgi:hypothetical protein